METTKEVNVKKKMQHILKDLLWYGGSFDNSYVKKKAEDLMELTKQIKETR